MRSVRLPNAIPHVRERLIAEWDRMRTMPRFSGIEYPGYALELLIASAEPDAEAARIFAAWLPSSEQFQASGAVRTISAQVLRVSPVREAAIELARRFWGELEKLPANSVALSGYCDMLAVIHGVWESDDELRGRYEQWLRGTDDHRFVAALEMGRRSPHPPLRLR